MSEPLIQTGVHRLFLPEEEGEEGVTGVRWITVRRLAPAGGNAGRVFDADTELPDIGALQRLFGGGTYEVTGRNEAYQVLKGAKRKYQLDGRPIPMEEHRMGLGSGGHTVDSPPAAVSPELALMREQIAGLAKAMEAMARGGAPQASAATSTDAVVAVLQSIIAEQRQTTQQLLTQLGAMATKKEEPLQTHEVFLAGMQAGQGQTEAIVSAVQAAKGAGGNEEGGEDELLKTVNNVIDGLRMFTEKDKKAPVADGQ